MSWTQRTLFECIPSEEKGLSFYYLPLTGTQQEAFRAQYQKVDTILELALAVFCARTMLFKVTKKDSTVPKFFTWPEDLEDQHVILSKIPDSIILEVGSTIMGWPKSSDEDNAMFMHRVMNDLTGNDDPFEV